MPFPNYPDKYTLPALLDPTDIIGYRRHLNRLPDIGSPAGLLLCLERGLPKRLRRRVPVRKAGSMLGDVYMVKKPKDRVAILADFGGGAPIVVELAEEFIALGTRNILLLTWGGALQTELKPGDIVVCTQAVRDEGTSHHYLPPGRLVASDVHLSKRLAEAIQAEGGGCITGTTWTTDAPYRETQAEVQLYQSEGVQVVEMESAGLFAASQFRGVAAASAVVVMDSLAHLRWDVPDRLNHIQKSLEIVYRAAVHLLGEL